MNYKQIWPAIFLVGLFTVSSATPASALQLGLSKQARDAATIDELRASDLQLTAAIATLDKEVGQQSAMVISATQALEAANKAFEENEKALADTRRHIDELRGIASQTAIQEYIRPQDDLMTHLLSADGFEDAGRRSEFLNEVVGRNYEILEELRAAREDMERRQKAALITKKIAEDRRAGEQKKLDDLNAARTEKSKLEASLKDRISAYAAEDDAAAAFTTNATSQGRASRGSGAEDDARISAAGLRWPVPDHRVSSPFGTRWGRLHAGIDIEAKIGTPISAAKSGTVISAGWESGYGNYTCLDHGGGFSSCYAHQSRILVGAGQTVNQGQLIGYSGNTGSSSGPHLHFETRVNGQPRDPERYLP